jgi:hypothetical protein
MLDTLDGVKDHHDKPRKGFVLCNGFETVIKAFLNRLTEYAAGRGPRCVKVSKTTELIRQPP